MSEVDISITTIARPENYIGSTLESLGSGIPIKLVVGSPQTAYLAPYRDILQYTIIDSPEEEWRYICDKNVWHRASWNYWRCLNSGIVNNNGVLILEDDVSLARGWKQRFERTIRAIEKHFGVHYVLALYSPYNHQAYKRGLLFEQYERRYFFGTQGMYFPERVRVEYAKHLRRNGVDSYHSPYDIVLKNYLIDNNINLFVTAPCLVQHIGAKTTGLGWFHQAPSFVESVSDTD